MHRGLSHLRSVILSQARFNGMLIKAIKRFDGPQMDYRYSVLEIKVDKEMSYQADAIFQSLNDRKRWQIGEI